MDRSTLFGALALIAALSPAAALADVPGAPPAVPPDCPPGTRLEGPYRYWRCVPNTPEPPPQDRAGAADVIDGPAPVEPTPPPDGAEPPPVAPTPPPDRAEPAPPPAEAPAPPPASASPQPEGWHTTAGCAVAPGSHGGSWALVLLAALASRVARRRID